MKRWGLLLSVLLPGMFAAADGGGSLVIRNWGGETRRIERDNERDWRQDGVGADGSRRYFWRMAEDPESVSGRVNVKSMAASPDGAKLFLLENIRHASGKISSRLVSVRTADGMVDSGVFFPERQLVRAAPVPGRTGEILAWERRSRAQKTFSVLLRVAFPEGKILAELPFSGEIRNLTLGSDHLLVADSAGCPVLYSLDFARVEKFTLPADQPACIGGILGGGRDRKLYYIAARKLLIFKSFDGVWNRLSSRPTACPRADLLLDCGGDRYLLGTREDALMLIRNGAPARLDWVPGLGGAARGRDLVFVAGERAGEIAAFDFAKGLTPVFRLNSGRGEPRTPGEIIALAASGENVLYVLNVRGSLICFTPYKRGWKKSLLRSPAEL